MTSVIAHRGASAARPENTVAAFAHAVELGADGVELDVRRSADGRLVISHDATFEDGRLVSETHWTDRPDGVCSLAEAIAACGGLLVNVEIKNLPGEAGYEPDAAIADDTVALLSSLGPAEQFLVSSFDLATIDRVRAIDRGPRTAWLTLLPALSVADVFSLATSRGHSAVHPYDTEVDAPYVAAATALGLEVNVWTVNDPDRMAELADLGVDGIVTDVPDVARRVVDGASAR